MRTTSLTAYRAIDAEGLLSKTRWQVYDVLFHNGPLTALETASYLKGVLSQGSLRNVNARLGELRDVGVVKENAPRTCTKSNQLVIEWDVTDALPTIRKKTSQWKKVAQFDTFLQLIRSDFPEQAKNRALDYSIETERSGTARVWVVYSKDYS